MAEPIDFAGITRRLLDYCHERNWAGADPYDALNSELLSSTWLYTRTLPRLVMTQLLKRSPWDPRPALGVMPVQNPKAHALFLQSVTRLEKLGMVTEGLTARRLVDELLHMRSPGQDAWCWGYSFPWQTRTHLVPKGAPNLVCTVFVANALLDARDRFPRLDLLTPASSAAAYIANDLFRPNGGRSFFAYPLPVSEAAVHNANLLAADLLVRVARASGRTDLEAPALAAARYSVSRQRADGSWLYGDGPKQRWIDNFHTGFNLGALLGLARTTGKPEFLDAATAGLQFYLDHFFTPEGAPRYFHDRTFPIDAHAAAQSIVTLVDFGDLDSRCPEQMQAVARWSVERLLDPQGYFYYRQLRLMMNRVSYMRWAQAWMLFALTRLLESQSVGCALAGADGSSQAA